MIVYGGIERDWLRPSIVAVCAAPERVEVAYEEHMLNRCSGLTSTAYCKHHHDLYAACCLLPRREETVRA